MSRSIEYASFLIRLWREQNAGPACEAVDWQSEVEHIQTGERWEFDTLEGLLSFLRRETEDGGRRGRCKEVGRG
jgi:hypothetical protein